MNNDKNFFLVTDTLPYELPLIYNNFKFNEYINVDEELKNVSVQDALSKHTKPIIFNIWKNNTSQRVLSLINPISQLQAYKFVDKYHTDLIDYCNLNAIYSLRYPSGKNSLKQKEINKIEREINSLLDENDDYINNDHQEFLDSYFSKKKYSRITSFYKSNQFNKLETRYKYLKRIDIKNCFAHIYTHSIDWAYLGNKELAKQLLSKKDRFSSNLDTLMQRCNFNETNGIVIGPEFSRYTAEVVLMRIDNLVEQSINDLLKYKSHDYKVYRYIDDIFIFSNHLEYLEEIHKLYEKFCVEYKLDLNVAKIKIETRPFIKERMWVPKLSACIDKYFIKFFYVRSEDVNTGIHKKSIHRININFINDLRWIISDYEDETEKIISYVLSAINKRCKEILFFIKTNELEVQEYFIMSIQDILHYSISLSITSPHIKEYVKILIKVYNFISNQRLIKSSNLLFAKNVELIKFNCDNYSIELLDVILFLRRIDKDLPESLLIRMLKNNTHYLTVGSLLFYINTNKRRFKFTTLKKEINKYIDNIIMIVNERYFENDYSYKNKPLDATCDFIYSDLFLAIHDFSRHPWVNNQQKQKIEVIRMKIKDLHEFIKIYSKEKHNNEKNYYEKFGLLNVYVSYVKDFKFPFMDYTLTDEELSELLVYKTIGSSSVDYSG